MESTQWSFFNIITSFETGPSQIMLTFFNHVYINPWNRPLVSPKVLYVFTKHMHRFLFWNMCAITKVTIPFVPESVTTIANTPRCGYTTWVKYLYPAKPRMLQELVKKWTHHTRDMNDSQWLHPPCHNLASWTCSPSQNLKRDVGDFCNGTPVESWKSFFLSGLGSWTSLIEAERILKNNISTPENTLIPQVDEFWVKLKSGDLLGLLLLSSFSDRGFDRNLQAHNRENFW